MNQNMQVSVVLPTYNRMKDLAKCLDSIIVQTTLPKEIIIVDDSDNNEIENLIGHRKDDFKEKGMDLIYIRNGRERSLTIAENIGIENVTGDIFLILDSDVILDKNYIEEVLMVYKEKPDAKGVQGLIQNGKKETFMTHRDIHEHGNNKVFSYKKKMISLSSILGRLHLTSSFTEKNKCRVYPSLTVSYPHSSLNKIINCEWLSGANQSYKREIFDEFKYDEKLKKYSWGEDTDFSYRVFKKYPHSLFLTPHAKLIHKASPAGRIPKKEITYMGEIYYLYIFLKIIDQNIKNKLIYLWSGIGRLIYKIIYLILKPSKSKFMKIKYSIGAYVCCMKHIKEIKEGNLEFFNKGLR